MTEIYVKTWTIIRLRFLICCYDTLCLWVDQFRAFVSDLLVDCLWCAISGFWLVFCLVRKCKLFWLSCASGFFPFSFFLSFFHFLSCGPPCLCLFDFQIHCLLKNFGFPLRCAIGFLLFVVCNFLKAFCIDLAHVWWKSY